MSSRTIVYGEIIDRAGRQELIGSHRRHTGNLQWKDHPARLDAIEEPSLVFVDLDDPRFSNPEFLLSLSTTGENIRVIGKLNQPDIDKTIRVSKLGVSEVLTPSECLERLHIFMNDLEKEHETEDEKPPEYSVESLIGKSRDMAGIRKTIRLLSEVDFPSALILGETGTGKSLVTKILHNTGVRSKHNLVEVNCSAIPDELFESELFGHTKGAFTDAKSEKTGLFEYARGGTLFLDEVGNLSSSAQAKLLKILEDKKLRKVGDVNVKDINVRVVAATNTNLREAIETGKFREDLFFRLNLLTLEIPPLRKRPEDIAPMIERYLTFYSTIYNKPDIEIEDDAVREMEHYSWPGNVRELCNVIERTVLLSKNRVIRLKDIKAALRRSRISPAERRQIIIDLPPYGISLREIEENVVKQVLNIFNWNKSETAKFLAISRPRLRRIIETGGLEQNRRKS